MREIWYGAENSLYQTYESRASHNRKQTLDTFKRRLPEDEEGGLKFEDFLSESMKKLSVNV